MSRADNNEGLLDCVKAILGELYGIPSEGPTADLVARRVVEESGLMLCESLVYPSYDESRRHNKQPEITAERQAARSFALLWILQEKQPSKKKLLNFTDEKAWWKILKHWASQQRSKMYFDDDFMRHCLHCSVFPQSFEELRLWLQQVRDPFQERHQNLTSNNAWYTILKYWAFEQSSKAEPNDDALSKFIEANPPSKLSVFEHLMRLKGRSSSLVAFVPKLSHWPDTITGLERELRRLQEREESDQIMTNAGSLRSVQAMKDAPSFLGSVMARSEEVAAMIVGSLDVDAKPAVSPETGLVMKLTTLGLIRARNGSCTLYEIASSLRTNDKLQNSHAPRDGSLAGMQQRYQLTSALIRVQQGDHSQSPLDSWVKVRFLLAKEIDFPSIDTAGPILVD